MRRRRILSACFGNPAWGEGSAWAYDFHRIVAGGTFDSLLVWLLTDADVFYFRHVLGDEYDNPDRLGGVRRCVIREPIVQRHAELSELIEAFDPELLVGWGSLAERLVRHAAPARPLVLMGVRCDRLERLIGEGVVRDYAGFRAGVADGIDYVVSFKDPEREAFRTCDLVMLPSALAHAVQRHLYASQAGKIYARPLAPGDLVEQEASRFSAFRRPFAERDIDVVFVGARWDRAASNFALVNQICRHLGGRNVHLVGESGWLPHVTGHGLLSRRALFELLGRSRVAVFPGLADAAAEGLLEASSMGCNVVASPECGLLELCHDDLRVARPSAAAFIERIAHAWPRALPDHRERFLGDASELIDTLAVF